MFYFDGRCEPPTALELKEVQQQLKLEKKHQLQFSCLSDLSHGLLFLGLYYFDFLSGRATLTAIIFATACAIVLANYVHQPLSVPDKVSIAVTAIGALLIILILLTWWMKQQTYASLIAACAGSSIVIVGAVLGRKVKQVISNLEDLKPFCDDSYAKKELVEMCRTFPEIVRYRDQAKQILRPNLTYGELKAMRTWSEDHSADGKPQSLL